MEKKSLLFVSIILGLFAFAYVSHGDDSVDGEKFTFQAEVSRLMNIIINSLYSEKEIFLRELISNASDALDKIRFAGVTDPSLLGEGDTSKLEIRIKADEESKTLIIRDRGVAMSKQELIDHLGTIAKSGTRNFMDAMKEGEDLSLIGQFGVGFYSAFLVADTVEVASKSNDDDTQWVWISQASDSFDIIADPRGNTLERGTEITLHLKEDAEEYLEQERLETIIRKYSEFIDYPIYLWTKESEWIDVPIEEEEEEAVDVEAEVDEAEDGVEVKEEEEDDDDDDDDDGSEGDEPKTEKKEIVTWDWKLMNENKPIWTRPKDEITEDEYNSFYKSISRDTEDPMAYTHFSAEGEHEFKSILFIPGRPPYDMFQSMTSTYKGVKLYVRRVFITDDFEDLLPKYLHFIRGVIDSDDVPINVSREMLQQHRSLRVIKKKLVRKALEMIKGLAQDEEAPEVYDTFLENYGNNLKLGVIDDFSNKNKIIKLLKFYTSAADEIDTEKTNLESYVERMKEDQEFIYYLGGESVDAIKDSPVLEELYRRGYEVLYLTEPIDEYLTQSVTEFDGKKFMNAGKEDLKFGKDEEEDEEEEEALTERFQPAINFLQQHLGSNKVSKVTLSKRLSGSPAALVTSSFGFSANMERIMKAQAMADPNRPAMEATKTLEINPRHPIVKELNSRLDNDESAANEDANKDIADLLYDTSLLTSGFSLDNSASFADRITRMLQSSLGISPNETADPPPEIRKKSKDEEQVDDQPDSTEDDLEEAIDLDNIDFGGEALDLDDEL